MWPLQKIWLDFMQMHHSGLQTFQFFLIIYKWSQTFWSMREISPPPGSLCTNFSISVIFSFALSLRLVFAIFPVSSITNLYAKRDEILSRFHFHWWLKGDEANRKKKANSDKFAIWNREKGWHPIFGTNPDRFIPQRSLNHKSTLEMEKKAEKWGERVPNPGQCWHIKHSKVPPPFFLSRFRSPLLN